MGDLQGQEDRRHGEAETVASHTCVHPVTLFVFAVNGLNWVIDIKERELGEVERGCVSIIHRLNREFFTWRSRRALQVRSTKRRTFPPRLLISLTAIGVGTVGAGLRSEL